jgi:hypothetical protein
LQLPEPQLLGLQTPPQPSLPHTRPWQLGTHTHVPAASHVSFAAQLFGLQTPPQLSDPHSRPAQSGLQVDASTHVPSRLQTKPVLQPPQLPPQPSSPQMYVELHFGAHLHSPAVGALLGGAAAAADTAAAVVTALPAAALWGTGGLRVAFALAGLLRAGQKKERGGQRRQSASHPTRAHGRSQR